MDAKDNTPKNFSLDAQTILKISELCNIILVYEDSLNISKAKKYIKEHIENDIIFQGDKYSMKHVVQEEVRIYIEKCPTEVQLFAFDSDSGLHKFRKKFKDCYNESYYELTKKIDALAYPNEFEDVFDCIQDSIDIYTMYRNFSIHLEDKIQERVQEKTKRTIKESLDEAKRQIKLDAESVTNKTIENTLNDGRIENEVKTRVNEKMNDITKNISETSVTILGMFTGIVLTVVAGLFYSSSVLDNVNSANFCRLISVSALIGFVCYSLLALMFRYIERIKYKNDTMPRFNRLSIVVGCVLLLIMTVFGILQYCDFNKESDSNEETTNTSTTEQNTTLIQDISVSENSVN